MKIHSARNQNSPPWQEYYKFILTRMKVWNCSCQFFWIFENYVLDDTLCTIVTHKPYTTFTSFLTTFSILKKLNTLWRYFNVSKVNPQKVAQCTLIKAKHVPSCYTVSFAFWLLKWNWPKLVKSTTFKKYSFQTSQDAEKLNSQRTPNFWLTGAASWIFLRWPWPSMI